MLEKNELISFAMDFASYLVSRIPEINRIVLYGSVARGDFDNESDVDLFIDTKEKIEKKVEKALEIYEGTKKFKEWELKGIKREIHTMIGELDSEEWKNLKRSVMINGITLYGKYKAESDRINHYALVSFENIKPDKKRIVVFRTLFGFNIKGKRYPGLVEKTNSKRFGKGTLIVPIENYKKIEVYLRSKKITFRIIDFWTDEKIT